MCDTILAPPGSTAEYIMLFGKNSDRERNEAQAVEYFPRASHAPDAQLTCTYLTVPQARQTHAVLLCRPFWIWGAEMGANDHGVVIGNEGLHARSPAPQEKALTGMDLIRLALERATTAAEALDVMTTLLRQYGQGGNCGHLTPAYYNNSFMVADPTEAIVLETVDREWLTERVRGVCAISNAYSIGRNADRISAGLSALVRDSGWSAENAPDYAGAIANPDREHIGHAGARRARSIALLSSREGQLGAADMMRILRDHGPSDSAGHDWYPEKAIERTLCAHAGDDECRGQTVGSMVSEIRPADAVHWVTGTAAPCTSIFKPVLFDAPLPSHGPRPTDRFDSGTMWWRRERLHRTALMGDFAKFLDDIRQERDSLEASFHTRVKSVLNGGSVAERSLVVDECWKEAMETEDRWFAGMERTASQDDTPYRAAWFRLNRISGIDASL